MTTNQEFIEAIYWLWWRCAEAKVFHPSSPEFSYYGELFAPMRPGPHGMELPRAENEVDFSRETLSAAHQFFFRFSTCRQTSSPPRPGVSYGFSAKHYPIDETLISALRQVGLRDGNDEAKAIAFLWAEQTYSYLVKLDNGRVLHVWNTYPGAASINNRPELMNSKVQDGLVYPGGRPQGLTVRDLRALPDCVDLTGFAMWPGWHQATPPAADSLVSAEN